MRKFAITALLSVMVVALSSGIAFAQHSELGDRTVEDMSSMTCIECHETATMHTSGPHGGYQTTTDRCGTCHDVHANTGNAQLLAGQTLTDACQYCHDLTGTHAGPYHMTIGTTVGAAHRVVGISTGEYVDTEGDINNTLEAGITAIPGGNGADGSAGTLDGSVQGRLSGTVFTCDSCHTPHGVNTVNPYLGESDVKVSTYGLPSGQKQLFLTTRLLKTKPNNAADEVTEYGSKWCLACHKGRNALTDPTNHNHPVSETTSAYSFLDIAVSDGLLLNGFTVSDIVSDGKILVDTNPTPTAKAELRKDPRSNKQYAMTTIDELTNTERPDGYLDYNAAKAAGGPACQQCHGSARNVEAAFVSASNPAAGNFPHISKNLGLLVETADDFCTNCHAPSQLP